MGDLLSPLDSLFVHLDSPRTPMHMGSVGIFEGAPFTAPDGRVRVEELRAEVAARLPLVPKLRQRVSRSPLWLLARQWDDDAAFDITAHVRRAAVPAPGSDDQLWDLCAELLSWPLCRSRPLWELWVIEGLAGGRVAVLEKLHHAMADGLGGVELAAVLLDLERHPRARPVVADDSWPHRPPGGGERLVSDVVSLVGEAGRRTSQVIGALGHPRRAVLRTAATAEGMRSLFAGPVLAPRCSLNAQVGRRRRFVVVRQRLDSLHTVQRWAGVTLNEVLLTAVAGGIRALHLSRGESLHEVRVMVPVGFDHHGDHHLGNRVSTMVVPVPMAWSDPVECLHQVARASTAGKRHHQATGAAAMLSVLGTGLEPGIGAVAEMVQHQPFVNLVVTNVPGPSTPLYAMGAKMLEAFPVVPLAGNLTLGVAAFSYDGRLGIGIVADRQRCPDIEVVARGMEQTFRALVRAARAAGAAPPVSRRRPRRARREAHRPTRLVPAR